MNGLLVSTVNSDVCLISLRGLILTHPNYEYDMLLSFTEQELLDNGEDLIKAIEQGELTASYNGKPILNREDYFNLIRTYSREEVIRKLREYREFVWKSGASLKDCEEWINEYL